MKIERFEDLKCWQKARFLAIEVYKITNNPSFSKDYGLKDQIRRAAVSVPSNIAEGFERGGNKELIQFLYIAKGSCGEVRTQLYLAKDFGYLSESEFQNLLNISVDITKLCLGFINYLKNSGYIGNKYIAQEPEAPYYANYEQGTTNEKL